MELASIEAPAGGGGREGREGVGGVEESVQDNKWEHPTGRMLAMAGLFDIWRTPKSVSCIFLHKNISYVAYNMGISCTSMNSVHVDPCQ